MNLLSPAGRAHLRLLLRFRDRPPTVWGHLAANRARYAILLAGTSVGAGLLYVGLGPIGAAFAAVAAGSALLRDVGAFRRSAAAWPALRSVIEWERVEKLLAARDGERAVAGPKTTGQVVGYLDFLIDRYVNHDSAERTPEATEAVLDKLDLVREAAITDTSADDFSWTAYSRFLFGEGYDALSFCGRQRRASEGVPLSDPELLARLKEFWGRYLAWDRRPRPPWTE